MNDIQNPDQLLNALQVNYREQFEQPIFIQARRVEVENKKLIAVFVPELEASAKPCTFKGKFDSKNNRKTGVWRRGINGDYECSQQELEPILLAKTGTRYEQIVLDGIEWEDLDSTVIELYRVLREKMNPNAPELQESDVEILKALGLVTKKNGEWIPNVTDLLLFAKPLALRRLLPAMRVDYHFRLEEGQMQRSDQPLLPQKVVREAVVNALMHRDYQVNQPTLIVRYSNRIEIRNAGYSLKPEIELGEMGSVLRNPIIANVLYDIGFAETKGSGIRTIRRLLEQAGLSEPVFHSQILQNQFCATYLLHQFLGEEQLNWLKQFAHLNLSHDEVRVLILARETDTVDNAGLRAVTGLDTLSASQVLSRLCKYQLLVKKEAGSAIHYVLASNLIENSSDFDANMSDLPEELQGKIEVLGAKPRVEKLQLVLLWLCSLRSYRAETLPNILQRQVTGLKVFICHDCIKQNYWITYIQKSSIIHNRHIKRLHWDEIGCNSKGFI